MTRPDLRKLLPEAPAALRALLDAGNAAAGGTVHPPIRSEIFGLDRFAQHGRSLGVTHNAALVDSAANTFFPRLRNNIDMLRQAQRYIGQQAALGEDISPAAEWLLDNFHLIEAQLKEIHDGLPGSYFRKLPVLTDEPLAGLPRVYGIAWAFVAHTDSAFDDDLLVQFLAAYQETRELSLAELWALPTTLRVVLIENLRRLSERVATHQAARELANLCADRAEPCTVPMLTALLARLNDRGVGRVFLAQLAQRSQRLPDPNRHSALGLSAVQAWLQAEMPGSVAEMAALQSVDQTANNLSVSNAVSSLRAIGDADWPDIVARTSPLMHLMLGAPMFEAEHPQTRDQTLHGIERLGRRSGRSEVEVAQALLALMQNAAPPQAVPIYWLQGAGRPALAAALGLHERRRVAWIATRKRLALPVYLGALALLTAALMAWLLRNSGGEAWPWRALLALLIAFPASEAVVAVINRLISESVQPRHLPRLAFTTGIPAEHRVLVVVPCMLTDPHSTTEVIHRLRLHHLANPDRQVQFALLSDWADAETETLPSDAALLAGACAQLRALNAESTAAEETHPTNSPRFLLLHRTRRFSPSEQRFIGWERKRGKLEQLMATMAEGSDPAEHFVDVGELSAITPGTRYVVTLDADTQLPPDRLRALVGVAAHPNNQPVLSADGRRVISGWGILQPRVVTPLPAPRDLTRYHWLFAGRCGIDPYSAASSEVYQDLFDEGTFTGKGLLHVHAMHAVLAQRLPEGQVLSHDLLEGSLVRCAAVTDITVVEDAPFHADVAAARVHRWTRGDWQLLPFLMPFLFPLRRVYLPLKAINRWKMFDNLRRSLVAPMSLALLLLVLALGASSGLTPLTALVLVGAAFLAGPLMGAVAGFSPSRDDLGLLPFYRQAVTDLLRALCGGIWLMVQLLHQALRALDAIGRALYRLTVSHRLLLQWTTAAAAQAQAQSSLKALTRQHAPTIAMAVVLAVLLLVAGTPAPGWSLLLCALWAASPLWTWFVSKPRGGTDKPPVSALDADYLRGVARDTWRLFERCIGPADRYLPPDNLQVVPHELLAHRTSPTNIGLYLLSACCARQFGWIGSAELLTRLNDTLATLDTMQRHRGHFLNWYDTQTAAPLLPMYVSTVDSGNFSGHLLAVAEALLALAEAPLDPAASLRALAASRARIAPLLALWPELLNSRPALAQIWADDSGSLDAAEAQLSTLLPPLGSDDGPMSAAPVAPSPLDQLSWMLADHLATLRSAALDREVAGDDDSAALSDGLRVAAQRCKKLAWAPDYCFLYHRKRHLFHIGYRVAEQTLDASFYDLLASESRLTSLLAIAKGDVSVQHWASLGRPFFAVGMRAGLRSWSGSMFEYLMPTLVLSEPDGSVLHDACRATLHEQRAFVAAQRLPWGISESAYAGQDHTLAYQYSPQGVPRLALRRTPPDELVIAPYATALAAQIDGPLACRNFAQLEEMGARGRYGFIEALDFSAARQTDSSGNSGGANSSYVPVATFMAHHQGMSIVALANVLLGGLAQRWGMGNSHIEAVSSLLHERAPREISKQGAPPPALPQHAAAARRAPGMLRDLLPGMAAVEPTHLLSNGRYAVSLRPNGAGQSRWRQFGLNRWRDDALRDEFGSFFYVRWAAQPQAVSLTQHPAPDPAAHYQSVIHADRVCFDTHWSQAQLQAHVTVWVSPEDDIEFRRVELRNGSDRAIEIELISSFEVSMADPRADEAHPAFSNMFVSAEWLAAAQALLFKRQPRLEGEPSLYAAHFLADSCPQMTGLFVQTDRQKLLGRNASASQPLLTLNAAGHEDGPLPTGLDPVCTLAVRLRIEPNAKALLTFATAASDQSATLRAVIDKYRQASHVQRASLMSATLAGIRLREMTLSPEYFAAQQSLTTALLFTLARPGMAIASQATCDRRLLWRLSLSGDRPILLVSLDTMQGLSLVRGLAQALRVWAWGGVACDLVVVNSEPASYQMALQRELLGLRERHVAQAQDGTQIGHATTFTLLRSDELSPGEQETLHALARLHFMADGRPLTRHVQDWLAAHQSALEARHAGSVTALLPLARSDWANSTAFQGSFADTSGEFRFRVTANRRPQRPWINVLANPDFGAQVSESGGGYSWAVNSRLMQLTAWSNDPVADPTSETFLIQDVETREAWSLSASALAANETYSISHGQGSTVISHRHGALDINVSWWVAEGSAVKRVRVQVTNRGIDARRLRIVGIVEWMMGANRGDRAATLTALHSQRLASGQNNPGKLNALLCTQTDHAAGFGDGTAFFAIADAGPLMDWTTDRRECFDARGRLILPDHFSQKTGAGLDPCAALASQVDLASGASAERVFLLGYAATPDAARQLATESAAQSPAATLSSVRQHWDLLLGATTVATPDPLFDALVNRWLLYQTLSCRLWAKAAFYQAGGATGFRDQLQDSMALAWAAPDMLRAQVLRCAARQFAEGDVQHWWHAPTGAGVRTHFSDDLLWLPFACLRYLHATGDASLLDDVAPFLAGLPIPEGAEDRYDTPAISAEQASIYEHAARTIDRSLKVGVHGLPLMGSGDWNDGMNRVGIGGKGESVWLAWFLCAVVDGFAPLADQRGDVARAQRWRNAGQGWRQALMGEAWDGQWFKRAFFDDGSPLGTQANPEARIDLIAQAWSVLSKAAPAHLQRIAMSAVRSQLFDAEAGLIRLLDPPLQHAVPSAGYIQAYPPGVRENGGQYSHAGVWALMAQAQHATSLPDPIERQRAGNLAWRYFTALSPAHRAAHPTQGPAYAIEPYVMAGDIYSQPPYVGRGGWSWYTGAAAWLHRASVESIFGLDQQADSLSFTPCLPSHWPQAELTLRRDGQVMRFILVSAKPEAALAAAGQADAVLLGVGEVLKWTGLAKATCFVVPVG